MDTPDNIGGAQKVGVEIVIIAPEVHLLISFLRLTLLCHAGCRREQEAGQINSRIY